MKAISPALPMTTPSRSSNGVDASAADEAFSALIAAVIGAPAPTPTPAPTSSSQPSARVDKVDDARPAAAASRATSRGDSSDGTAKGATDATGSADPGDPTSDPQATTEKSATKQADAPKPASSLKPASTAGAGKAAVIDRAAQQPKVPAGLEKAAAALAQALAASSGDATAAAPANGLLTKAGGSTPPAAKPGSALTEGQLPAQLVAATAANASHAASGAAPATVVTSPKASGRPAVAVDAKPRNDDKTPSPPAPVAATPTADAVPSVATLTQAGQPQGSSDLMSAAGTVAVAGAPTSDHAKSAAPKTATPDRPSVGDATPHFDAQLSAPPLAPATAQVASVVPPQQPQPAYPAGMVSQQIVQVVAPLRTAKDGDYTLSLQLHPADLGAVTVRVEVQQGVLSVHMSAEHAHGHEALSQSLADLRTQLQTSGVRTGDIVVAAKQSAMPQHQDQQHHASGRHQQEAPMYDDAGADRRPGERPSQHAKSQADDDNLDVRI